MEWKAIIKLFNWIRLSKICSSFQLGHYQCDWQSSQFQINIWFLCFKICLPFLLLLFLIFSLAFLCLYVAVLLTSFPCSSFFVSRSWWWVCLWKSLFSLNYRENLYLLKRFNELTVIWVSFRLSESWWLEGVEMEGT